MKKRDVWKMRAALLTAILLHAAAFNAGKMKDRIGYWIGSAKLLAFRIMIWIAINIRL